METAVVATAGPVMIEVMIKAVTAKKAIGPVELWVKPIFQRRREIEAHNC
jgi:hypothetical protein